MISKTITALLLLATVLVTSADDCSDGPASRYITTNLLTTKVAKWYGHLTSADYTACVDIIFTSSTSNSSTNNLIMTTQTIYRNGSMEHSVVFLEYVELSRYNVWRTDALDFDPQNPGFGPSAVPMIGRLIFSGMTGSGGVTILSFNECINGTDDVLVSASNWPPMIQGSYDYCTGT